MRENSTNHVDDIHSTPAANVPDELPEKDAGSGRPDWHPILEHFGEPHGLPVDGRRAWSRSLLANGGGTFWRTALGVLSGDRVDVSGLDRSNETFMIDAVLIRVSSCKSRDGLVERLTAA
jgi:hypothetical protein